MTLPKELQRDRGEDLAAAAICAKVYAAKAHLAAKAALNEQPSETSEQGCCSINRCAELQAAAITAAVVAIRADENARTALDAAQRKIGTEPSATMAAAVACLEPEELDEAIAANSTNTGRAVAEAVVGNMIRRKRMTKDAETQTSESTIAPDDPVVTDNAVAGGDNDSDNVEIDEVE